MSNWIPQKRAPGMMNNYAFWSRRGRAS